MKESQKKMMTYRKGRGEKIRKAGFLYLACLISWPLPHAVFQFYDECCTCVLFIAWESKSRCRHCRPLFTAVNIVVEILIGMMQSRNQMCSDLIVCVFPMFLLFIITSVWYKKSGAKGLNNSIHGRTPAHLLFWVHWSRTGNRNVFHVYLQNSNFTHLIIVIICV
jgi:hypothetical protein